MQKQILTTLLLLGFHSLVHASVPSGWMKLTPVAPNLETYASLESGAQSYVSLQKHEMNAKLVQFKEKLVSTKGAISFADFKAANVDRAGACFSMNLQSIRQPASSQRRLKETWCFEAKKAYVVIESGLSRVENDVLASMLQQAGYKGSAK